MTDHASKDWLRTAPRHAQTLRTASSLAVAGVVVAAVFAAAHIWGTAVGARDAMLMQQAERRAVMERCAEDLGPDARALVDQKTGAVICAAGSSRAAPLSHPLSRIQ